MNGLYNILKTARTWKVKQVITPSSIADAVSRRIPEFSCCFEPDFRQIIAESWPRSIDYNDA